MKTFLALIALCSVALPAGAAVVESFGASVPHLISAETGLALFVSAFALLLFGSSYAGPRRIDVKTPVNARWVRPALGAIRSSRVSPRAGHVRRAGVMAAAVR